jgi:hypothetical protein
LAICSGASPDAPAAEPTLMLGAPHAKRSRLVAAFSLFPSASVGGPSQIL